MSENQSMVKRGGDLFEYGRETASSGCNLKIKESRE